MRSSSVASFFDCPLRWASIHLYDAPRLPSTPPAIIGTACHAGTALYDAARIAGQPVRIDDAAEETIRILQDPDEEVDWSGVDRNNAERRALGTLTRYCTDVAPLIEYEAVELQLEPMTIDFSIEYDIEIALTGTLDRIYKQGQQLGVLDIKSGERVCSQKTSKHKAQLAVYELLAENTLEMALTLPALLARLQTSNEYTADIASIESSRMTLLGTDDQIGLLESAARMFQTGDFYGNSSSWLCSQKYCPIYSNCIFA